MNKDSMNGLGNKPRLMEVVSIVKIAIERKIDIFRIIRYHT